MKFLILLSCLAFASAGYPYYYANSYAQHVPIIDHNGVPLETPEVQAAKANHFAAHEAAKHGGYLHLGYTGHYGVAAVTADGRPLDTPEVQLAKAAHYIAYNQAAYRNAVPHAAIAAGPIDTPEVQIAKAAHLAAHAEAKARSGHYRKRRAVGYAYQPLPAIGQNGVPLDTPEVEAAKANHFAAHAQVQQSAHPTAGPVDSYSGPRYNGFAGYHVPVIGPNGVPRETPEVEAAKAEHFATYSKSAAAAGPTYSAPSYSAPSYNAPSYNAPAYNAPAYSSGAPQDTPEVQAAKAAHLAAHSAAGGHRYY